MSAKLHVGIGTLNPNMVQRASPNGSLPAFDRPRSASLTRRLGHLVLVDELALSAMTRRSRLAHILPVCVHGRRGFQRVVETNFLGLRFGSSVMADDSRCELE